MPRAPSEKLLCLYCQKAVSAKRKKLSGVARYVCSKRCLEAIAGTVGVELDDETMEVLTKGQGWAGLFVFFGRRAKEKLDDWRARQEEERAKQAPPPPSPSAETDEEKKLRILKALRLPPTATLDDVDKRYRELAKKVHPDVPGGSTERMAKLNAARDTLRRLMS